MHAALHSNSKVIVKIGYFSSITDIPEPTVLLSTLISTKLSAALLQTKYLTRPWTLYQCHGRAAHRQGKTSNAVIHAEHMRTLSTVLPEIYTGFLPSLSDKGPNVMFPISNPAKNRDDARLTL